MYYCYVKIHNVTGLKYLGITKQEPFKYKGSGTYWKRHLNKHGNDVSTVILAEHEDRKTLEKAARFYSDELSVATNDDYANLGPEKGYGVVWEDGEHPRLTKVARGERKQYKGYKVEYVDQYQHRHGC
jgi:hypothetical protein